MGSRCCAGLQLGIFATADLPNRDGVSISAHGAVYSVIVAHNEDLSRAQEIDIDPASETSVALFALSP